MGLFGEKEKCAVCGGKTSMLTKVKVSDGVICGTCRAKCGFLAKVELKTTAQIINRIKSREENAIKVSNFTPTDAVGDFIKVDRNSKTWCSPTQTSGFGVSDKNPDIFSFSDLIDFELFEDGVSITKGGLGTAVAGGILFGGVGAIVGGGLGKKQKDVVNKMSIIINLRDEWVPRIEIVLIKSETKRNSLIYKSSKSLAQQIISLLTIISDGQNDTSDTPSATSSSAADELLKFKQLLDMGVISQEEFDEKKKQLLQL